MLADSNQWNLFGYDLSRTVHYCRTGWQTLTRGREAGLRRQLEAPVDLVDADGRHRLYIAESPTGAAAPGHEAPYRAIALPAEDCLLTTLTFPASLETELASAVDLEIQSSNPFPADQSVSGWSLVDRENGQLKVLLAIASRRDIANALAEHGFDLHSGREALPEVWVLDEQGRPVVLEGFGEETRLRAYPARLAKFSARFALVLLLLLVLFCVPAVIRSLQAERMQGYLEAAQDNASEAQELREELVAGNELIEAIQALLDQQPDYYSILDRLSEQTPDTVYLNQFQMDGNRIRIIGAAANAAAYQELLINDDTFSQVTSPSAFRSDRRSGLENFVLDLRVADGGSQ